VKEGVQGNGGANDEEMWWCIDGPKRAGRTKLNDTMGKASGKEEEEGSVIEVGSLAFGRGRMC
jgi:hypothetical protein